MTQQVSPRESRQRLPLIPSRRRKSQRVRSLFLTLLLAISVTSNSAAQSAIPKVELPPELKTLVRAKEKMRKSLNELPNYTCVQRIERTRQNEEATGQTRRKIKQHNSSGRVSVYSALDSVDALQVEVALVDGKELYSWPGAEGFEAKPLPEIVGFGMVGTGDFAQHARAVFLNNAASLDYAGEEPVAGRRAFRYNYKVSLFMSGYSVSDGANSATVPYDGAIWMDAENADLLRMVVRTTEAPPPVNIASAVTQVDYKSVALGDSEFLLPASASLVTVFRNGGKNTNTTEFQNCRVFSAESSISFDASRSVSRIESSLALQDFELPANVSLTVRLDAEITSEKSVAGDRVEATVASDVKRDGDLLVPKGSVLVGRIRRLEKFTDPKNNFIVGLEFTELQTPNRRAQVKTELTYVTPFGGLVEQFGEERTTYARRGGGLAGPGIERTTVESFSTTAVPGTSELYIQANRVSIPRGLRMVWRTLPKEQ